MRTMPPVILLFLLCHVQALNSNVHPTQLQAQFLQEMNRGWNEGGILLYLSLFYPPAHHLAITTIPVILVGHCSPLSTSLTPSPLLRPSLSTIECTNPYVSKHRCETNDLFQVVYLCLFLVLSQVFNCIIARKGELNLSLCKIVINLSTITEHPRRIK